LEFVIIDKESPAYYTGREVSGSFEGTDKGTPGVILGRKAVAFFDFVKSFDSLFIQNRSKDVWPPKCS